MKNIVELDLSNLPVVEKELAFIGTCLNLEKLEIDKTRVNDQTALQLKTLSKLKVLKIFDTEISDVTIEIFKSLPNLEKLYIKDTKITAKGISSLIKTKPSLNILHGIDQSLVSYFIKDSLPKIEVKTK